MAILQSEEASAHLVNIHPRQFIQQPQEGEMGWLTNQLKRRTSEYMPLEKILDLFSRGHCGILANVNRGLQFQGSDLIAIDVDDDHRQTEPSAAFEQSGACGLFYTFSHGIKGNRYRLVFRFDAPITNEKQYKAISQIIAEDLKEKGIPTDARPSNYKLPVRGGKSGQYLYNPAQILSTHDYIRRVKERDRRHQERLYQQAEREFRPLTFDEMKEMAEFIGHIPRGSGEENNRDYWQCLYGIKLYEEMNFITGEQAYELFSIISGGEESDRIWERHVNPNGRVSIGSFIAIAKKRGYEGRFQHLGEPRQQPVRNYKQSTLRVPRYIPMETARDLLQMRKRLLIESPTGSGKTESMIGACKDLAEKENHFYIFAAPTIPLTQQIAKQYGVQEVYGSKVLEMRGSEKEERLFKELFKYVRNGGKVFVSTYDMTPKLIESLKRWQPTRRFTLVIDEYHKVVTDYGYRKDAIRDLYEVSKEAKNLIALSGTPEEIDKGDFDEVLTIQNGQEAAQITDFAVYTYEKRQDGLTELTTLLETRTKSGSRKLLVYIENKKAIETIYRVLRKKGIETRKVTSETKKNPTFKKITEDKKIDDDVQVILATSAIADGISIENGPRFEVLVVCTDFSPLFSTTTLKQMSNRLRNHYDQFSIFMQEQKQEDKLYKYNFDNQYLVKQGIAEFLISELNNDATFESGLFHRSIIENRYGLYYDEEKEKVGYDPLHLRHKTSTDRQLYYRVMRESFVQAVRQILRAKDPQRLNVSHEIRNDTLAAALMQGTAAAIAEEIEETEEGTPIGKAFTQIVYQAFRTDSTEILNEFEKVAEPRHVSHLRQTCQVAGYKTCRHLVQRVQRDADTHAFLNDVRALNDIFYFEAVRRNTPTKKALRAILDLDDWLTTAEYNEALLGIAQKQKVTKKDIKAVERMVILGDSRTGRERFKRVEGTITVEHIARKHEIEIPALEQIMINVARQNPKKAFAAAIESKIQRRPNTESEQETLF